MNSYISAIMGEGFVTTPLINLQKIYECSSCTTPVIFILGNGCNPTNELFQLAKLNGFCDDQIHLISLGSGRECVNTKTINLFR